MPTASSPSSPGRTGPDGERAPGAGKPGRLAGCSAAGATGVLQFLHLFLSLGPLLGFATELRNGDFRVDPATGAVEHLGGPLFEMLPVLAGLVVGAFVLCAGVAAVGRRAGARRAAAVHFLAVLGVKALQVRSIYYSGTVEPAILAERPLTPRLFAPDALALALALAALSMTRARPDAGRGA